MKTKNTNQTISEKRDMLKQHQLKKDISSIAKIVLINHSSWRK